jgi:signal transduction histidine kinase
LLSEIKEIQYELDWDKDFEAGLENIKKKQHHVYLVDYYLGVKDGLQLIQQAHKNGIRKPFIMLTGQGNRKLDFKAMQLGAADYLVKGQFNAETLERSIRYSLKTNQASVEKKDLQKRLFQAQKMESIGTLAGGIAHDFNNILTSIIGFAQLARDRAIKDSDLEDDLSEIYTAGLRAKQLVSQILTFARKNEKEINPLRVDSLLKEVTKFIRSSIPTSIEIKSTIKSKALIMGNQTQVHQIFMNLFTNESQAMEIKGGGILEVSMEDILVGMESLTKYPNLEPGEYLKITVSDTGDGIPENIIESIFEPYFTTKKEGEGTGMGLAVVHGIVASYGGEILVSSELGKGTVFTLFLPTTKKTENHEVSESEDLPKGTERILLVDDEQSIVKLSQRVLEKLGYQVTSRTSSIEALELFKSSPNEFDLVITDMTMPKMKGDKLAQSMMDIKPELPIILCTGYNQKLKLKHENSHHIRAILIKPISQADFAKNIRKVLDEGKVTND